MSGNFLLIVPTYNEAENIELFLDEVLSTEVDILVVDDNSPDGTSELVTNKIKKNSSIHLLSRKKKEGLGSAYRDGFKWGLNSNYDYFIEMDADFSHRVTDLVQMIGIANQYNLVIGSRYISGGGSTGWSKRRKLLSRGANIFASVFLRSKIKDLTSGFRIYSREALNLINYSTTTTDGYGFQIEMSIRCVSKRLNIFEFPIIFEERREGESKMSFEIIIEAMFLILKLFPKRYLGMKIC